MEPAEKAETVETMELHDYLNVIRARKWVIIQAVVIVTLVALVVSVLQPKQYVGEVQVLISEQDSTSGILSGVNPDVSQQGVQTQAQLIQLRPLAEQVIRKLNLRQTPEQLLKRVDISQVGQTNVVTVDVTDGSPTRAAAIANAMAQAYVDWSTQASRENIKAVADEIQQSAAKDPTLAQKLSELRVEQKLAEGPGRVVSPAITNPVPVSPQPLRDAGLGLGVGLVFGVGMAFLFEYLDNTVKTTSEAEKVYGAPVLGHIPAEQFEKDEKRHLTTVPRVAESYRLMRNSLDFVNFDGNLKTLMVTSAAPGEGKSTVAANLAVVLAQTGKRVVLISCDFRRPTTEQFFGIHNVIGLSDVLTGANSIESALQRPGDGSVMVLTSGRTPPNPSELLGSEKMRDLLEHLGKQADWIILDTPPVLAVADTTDVARWVDGVLMVSRGGSSTRQAGKRGREALEKVGARIIGVAVWGLPEPGGREGSAYGYGYGYGYGEYLGYYSGYHDGPSEGRKSKKTKHTGSGVETAAGAVAAVSATGDNLGTAEGTGTGAIDVVRSSLWGLLGFAIAVIVALAIALLFDRSLLSQLSGLLG